MVSKGGLFHYNKELREMGEVWDRECNKYRDSWWGWHGYSGSVLQWDPELKISIAYVPANPMFLDIGANRAGIFQGIITQILKGEEPIFKDCSGNACNIF